MISMAYTKLRVRNGRASIPGMKEQSNNEGIVLDRREDLIAVRWPAGNIYQTVGSSTNYVPGTIDIYRIEEVKRHQDGSLVYTCKNALWWYNRRTPEPVMEDMYPESDQATLPE